jgi:hypothetical protein
VSYARNITIVVTAAVAANLRDLSKRLEKSHCDGMFTQGLSASGNLPATHFISSGHVPAVYLNAVTNNVRLYNLAKAAWEADGDVFPYTQAQVTNALNNCTLHDGTFTSTIEGVTAARPESPHALLARLGLKLIHPSVP